MLKEKWRWGCLTLGLGSTAWQWMIQIALIVAANTVAHTRNMKHSKASTSKQFHVDVRPEAAQNALLPNALTVSDYAETIGIEAGHELSNIRICLNDFKRLIDFDPCWSWIELFVWPGSPLRVHNAMKSLWFLCLGISTHFVHFCSNGRCKSLQSNAKRSFFWWRRKMLRMDWPL